jgi:hypothetical protein
MYAPPPVGSVRLEATQCCIWLLLGGGTPQMVSPSTQGYLTGVTGPRPRKRRSVSPVCAACACFVGTPVLNMRAGRDKGRTLVDGARYHGAPPPVRACRTPTNLSVGPVCAVCACLVGTPALNTRARRDKSRTCLRDQAADRLHKEIPV